MIQVLQRKYAGIAFLTVAEVVCSSAQQPAKIPPVSETVVVIGSPEPLTLNESYRSTAVINTEEHRLAFSQAMDYLRTDASVFVAQRGEGGSQADISIRGTSFTQTLLLVNGMRINDAETSHNNMDLPVPLAAMRSIDVLHGAGSTLYGSDALGGVIDFVTTKPTVSSLLLRAGGGSNGINEQEMLASAAGRKWSEVLAGQRDESSGFMYDRDYRTGALSSETRWDTAIGTTDILLASNDRAFGANQFYGNYPSYERTKGWFASLGQDLGTRTRAAFAYRRHTDQYVLFRNNPSIYENNHVVTSWQGVLRRHNDAGKHVKLFYGLESNGDTINSSNLGVHSRNWGSGYVSAEMRWGRMAASAGLRQEIISGGYRATSPMLAAGYHLTSNLKLRAATGYGFRLPTYLDLYYNDPTTTGNANLRPESAWSFEGGVDWYASDHLSFSSTVFHSRQHNAIDYVRTDASQKWRAVNLSGLSFTGWENAFTWRLDSANQFRASWTLLTGAQRALGGLQSAYVFNYPIHNANLEAVHLWKAGVAVHTRIGVTERYKRDPYAVWNLSLAQERGRWRPYLRVSNVTNTGYQEVLGVQMPGRQIVAGMQISLTRGDR